MTSHSSRHYQQSYGKHRGAHSTELSDISDADTHYQGRESRGNKNQKQRSSSNYRDNDSRTNKKSRNDNSSRDSNRNRSNHRSKSRDNEDDRHFRSTKKYSGGYMNKRGNQGRGNTHGNNRSSKSGDQRSNSRNDQYSTPRKNSERNTNNQTTRHRTGSRSQKSNNYGRNTNNQTTSHRTGSRSQNSYSHGRNSKNSRNRTDSNKNRTSHSKSSYKSRNSDDFDDALMDINIKKAQTSYNFFIKEMMEKDGSNDLIETTQKYSKQWREMENQEKEKYEEMADEDVKRFEKNMKLVRENILNNNYKEKGINHSKMAYLDEVTVKAIEEGGDLRDARKGGRSSWKQMHEDDRSKYHNRHNTQNNHSSSQNRHSGYSNDEYNPNRINGYSLFAKAQMAKARENGSTMTLAEVADVWRETDEDTKQKYLDYSDIIKEERKNYRGGFETVTGLKPRRPLGAYKIFMVDMARQGKFEDNQNVFAETSRLWEKCSDEEKEKYQKIAHREKLEYMVKKMEFIQGMRRQYGKARTAYNLFTHDMRDKIADMNFKQGEVFEYLYDQWCKCDDQTKQKYEEMAEQEKVDSEKRREELKEQLTSPHKRTPTPYAIFIRERAPQKKSENQDTDMNEVFRELGEEWKSLDEKEKDKYYEMYERELKEDGNQNRHFHNRSTQENDGRRRSYSQYKTNDKRSKNNSSGNKYNTQQNRSRNNAL